MPELLAIRPRRPAPALLDHANALRRAGRPEEAIPHLRQILRHQPDWAEAHLVLGECLLLTGHFLPGWQELEWRWRMLPNDPRADFPQPLWDGGNIAGKRIFLWAEQGFGDTIQFIRYATLIKNLGATVLVECQAPLVRLLASSRAIDGIVPYGAPLPAFDCHLPLQSIPALLNTPPDSIPNEVPYLTVPGQLVAHWRERIQSLPGKRIGLVWAGNPQQSNDRNRSMPLSKFKPLAGLSGITWVSLQKGDAACQPAPSGLGLAHPGTDWLDFADTAAIIQSLDLVVSVDTAVAHLAGALARPVWTLLCTPPDYRWLLDRQDSPWYPTMRLYRQAAPGDWDSVIRRVVRDLL